MRLKPSLSPLETWGFGFSGLLLWLGPAPAMHAALGPQAIFVWLPGVIVGMLLNFQVKQLGTHWTQMAGGTPNYTTRLLEHYPKLAAYAAIGYFFGWAAVPLVNAIILTDLITANLSAVGIACPQAMLKLGFTLLAFVVAFSGTRALGILHLFFVLPAVGLLLAFCVQGIGWLTLSPASPGFLPTDWQTFDIFQWAKWFFIIVYAVYACETASSFVADSHRPTATLRCLSVTAWLMPVVYLGGSWVLMRLSIKSALNDNAFLNLLSASTSFWGQSASLVVTFLIASSCLLTCATGFSNAPRIIYQLALDGYLAPVFAVVSRRGVLGPALIFTLAFSLVGIIWGDVSRVVMITGTGYFVAIMATHLGLWLRRDHPAVKWSWWSIAFFGVECVVLVTGGLAWDWQDFLVGLLLPAAILGLDAMLRRLPIAIVQPQWWLDRDRVPVQTRSQDFVAFQVTILLLLICGTAIAVWLMALRLGNTASTVSTSLFIVLLLTLAFLSIGIACWTSLPQVISIAKAREQTERLLTSALDGILVLDQDRIIRQINPAAATLFGMESNQLIGRPFQSLFAALPDNPQTWASRSEQILQLPERGECIMDMAIADSSDQDSEAYLAIVRDITERKQTEKVLRANEEALRQQAEELAQTLRDLRATQAQLIQTEKMSSLGQLVAGIAHEINNPVNFIHGNVIYASEYANDLLDLVQTYQVAYPEPLPEIQAKTEAIDLTFLQADLPNLLNSMKVGTDRIRDIVLSLRTFSRVDEADVKAVDIHEGIDSTLMILQSRLKEQPDRPAIHVIKEYGVLPLVECYAGALNQVFMNIIVNAIDAIDEAIQSSTPIPSLNGTTQNKALGEKLCGAIAPTNQPASQSEKPPAPSNLESIRGTIAIRTAIVDKQQVTIQISDNGPGMSEAVQQRLLDPFFTTKPVGKGTGMGLAISYQIITEKHHGSLKCISAPGQGTLFTVTIPLKQKKALTNHA